MSSADRRGEVVALLGGLLSLLGAILMAILAIWCESASAWTAAFQVFGAAGIWLLCLIQLHQQRLVSEERMEVEELERQRRTLLGGAKTIFDEEDLDQMDKLAMGRRLRTIERYLIPAIALLLAAFFAVAGISVFSFAKQFPPIAEAVAGSVQNATALLFFAGGASFVYFMMSRYALGLSHLPNWSQLRAGGNFMFGSSLLSFAVALAVLCVISGLPWVEKWLAQFTGGLLIFLAAEIVVNFILDFYRPRVRGLAQRPFYDSRLLGMFSEPGGILRSLANAVDYQFGFKVSETWFYRLLGRIVLPLLLVQIAVIFALTCITVVPPGHKAVIEHLGTDVRVVGPGTHITWCWPIDRATVIPVEAVQRLEIGFERDPRDVGHAQEGPLLWTKRHYKKEYQLVVADRLASANVKVPINLLSMNMPVQWRVKDDDAEVLRFHGQSSQTADIIQSLAYRELTRYAAGADVLDILGGGGIAAAEEIHQNLQKAVDEAGYDGKGLGVQIVFVGIGGVHPPPDKDVASTYEQVVGAFEKKDAKILEAEGEAASIRLAAAGPAWQEIYNAISIEDEAHRTRGSEEASAREHVVQLLRTRAGGRAREIVSRAEKRTVTRVLDQKSDAELYTMQLEAFNAAPYQYQLRGYLKLLQEGLQGIRKYVIVLEDSSRVIYEIDLKPPQGIDILGAEQRAAEAEQKANK